MPKYIYNHKKDEVDSRDHLYENHEEVKLHLAKPIPSKFDLRDSGNEPPIVDQGALGSCQANSLASNMRFCIKKEKLVDYEPSRLFIYYFARIVDGSPTDQDTGLTARGALKSVAKYGCCPETEWVYDITKYTIKPSQQAINDAKKHIPGFQYLSVNKDLTHIKLCISQGFPLLIGIQVYESFETEKVLKTGNVPMPNTNTESLLGGHALMITGFSDDTQLFTVANSWSSSVGDHGFFYLPYAYVLDSKLTYNPLWTVRFFR